MHYNNPLAFDRYLDIYILYRQFFLSFFFSVICLRKGLIFLVSGGEYLFSTGSLAVLVMTCYLTVKVYILVLLSSHLAWGNDL